MGKLTSIDECAVKCKGKASMFSFNERESGRCFCETSAINGECNQKDMQGYHLYNYQGNVSFLCVTVIIKYHIREK